MKILIKESSINQIIDQILDDEFGNLEMEQRGPRVYFINNDGDENFFINSNGVLVFQDKSVYNRIKDVFGFRHDEVKRSLENYFKEKYDIDIRNVTSFSPE